MLFKINQNINQNALKKINKVNKIEISENELEKLIISTKDDEKSNIEINYNYGVLSKNIFGEELFFISNQVATGKLNKSNSKYADIIAVDRQGNSVIIELKKHKAKMGVDMQALQYAVLFSAYRTHLRINCVKI